MDPSSLEITTGIQVHQLLDLVPFVVFFTH